ncbi:hypothetical protein BLNAU_8543 [Blattamonas nauphoetae]|uniref:Uncharacterized protein n=1 Tax=Blattamonas nauphoetae TaxID=2049346 RepID=A0ABQ9XYD8_9EUKA|nr:hypothetical protein BLNAU_8543 [Blattamonas nauphoetae]
MPCSICSMRAFLSSALIFLLIWTTLFGAFLLVLAAQAAPLKDVQSFIYGGPLEGFLEMEVVTKFFDRVFGNVESGKVKKLNCAANAATMLAEGLASSDLHSAFTPLESQPTLTPSLLAPNLPSLIRNFSIVYNIQPLSKLPAQVVGWYWHWKDVATDSPLVSALSTGLDKQGAFVQKLKKEGGQNVLLYDLTKAGVSDTFSSAVETLVKNSPLHTLLFLFSLHYSFHTLFTN